MILAILNFLGNILAKIGINLLQTDAKKTTVENNDAKIDVKPDSRAALDRLKRL